MKSQYVLPITIVVAGVLIAGAVFLAGIQKTAPGDNGKTASVRPYTPGIDHILGNPDAQVKIIEYVDLECPYCKTFHTTMLQVMDYYGKGGKVAWVVRPFPLVSIHSKAPQEHQAAECAADQGGDTAYYTFIDKVFAITPSSNNLDLKQLPVIAQDMGLNVAQFNSCLSSGKFAQRVNDSYNEAIALGAQGTPYSVLMVGTDTVELPGNQPYDSMRAAIDAVLGNTPSNSSGQATTTQ